MRIRPTALKPVDANKLLPGTTIRTDICIVGSGAAGLSVANEFLGTSREVCILEGGGYGPNEETQSLYDLESIGYPIRENFMSRARYYGGTCNLWAGRTMRLEPIDLAQRSWIPNSGWPMPYSELARYYHEGTRALRLPSFQTFDQIAHPLHMSEKEISLFDNDQLRAIPILWGTKPFRFGTAYKSKLQKAPNITLYLNANVTEINLDDSGTYVASLSASTLGGTELVISASYVVLACGGLENARLLLVSRGVCSSGVGNEFDVVGRYYMDHPRAIFGQVRLHPNTSLPKLMGYPLPDGMAQIGIGLTEHVQRKEHLHNSYVTLEPQLSEVAQKRYESSVRFAKIVLRKGYAGRRYNVFGARLAEVRDMIYLLTPKEIMPHALYRWYVTAKRSLNRYIRVKYLTTVNYCEQIPNPESRVYLSQKRDRLNMNTLILDWRLDAQESNSIARLHQVLAKRLVRSEIGDLESSRPEFENLSFTDASHHMGTTRICEDPKKGVVDAHCKVHGVSNLFVTGSSVFPTVGHANPTLTIVALAIRLADHLKEKR